MRLLHAQVYLNPLALLHKPFYFLHILIIERETTYNQTQIHRRHRCATPAAHGLTLKS